MTVSRRLLIWEGSSKKDFKAFPIETRKDMGVALFIVQLGGTPPSAKPWKGLGSGVYEIVDDHRGDTYGAVYVVNVGDCIHVLHAFQKKSKSGIQHAEGRRGTRREAIEGAARSAGGSA